ncbi:MAG TPA: FAD-dependent oxidoreductase [Chloroflexota bacterium]|nr:FAD-dependent oxidoreductase [Chloroflexota bacterium]
MSGADPVDSAYDVLVVGGGLAGLTAGLFAARYGHTTLVLESHVPGGHLLNVARIEDFPGFPQGIAGYDLCPLVQEQAEGQGAHFRLAEVERLEPQHDGWCLVTPEGRFRAPVVIVAAGARPRALGVPGEAELTGRGISHCATCDGPLFSGRVVGVVGGGDAALQEAHTLTEYVSRVVILNPAPGFTAQETYRRRVAEQPAIEVRHNVGVEEVLGDGTVSGVRLRDTVSGAESTLELAGLFVYAGFEPNTAILRDRLRLAADGRVPADSWLRTELPGVFVAGDVRQESPGHAITAAADGATAAIAAHRYLEARRASS